MEFLATMVAGDAVIQAATSDLLLAAARAKAELADQLQANAQLREQNRLLSEQLAYRDALDHPDRDHARSEHRAHEDR